ncbi:MAG: RluA family pseudouridine synthase [Planctomycetes bacterium]|nr:RluA family pseudouridine synthase [Planctomycetota bacterium]
MLAWLLTAMKPMSRTKVKDLLRLGQVLVNGAPTTQFDHPVQPGDRLAIARERPTVNTHALKRAGISIVFEDADVIVIDKPPGLLSVSTDDEKLDTAFLHLSTDLEARKAGRPYVVHRIDRETSGLLMFARKESVLETLKENWPAVEKTYLAVVEGRPRLAEGRIESYLVEGRDLRMKTCPADRPNAKQAISHYKAIQAKGKYTLIEVKLETGRKHQIRVHLAGLGCPVIGDESYRAKTDPAKRLGLHAWRLAFPHPVTGVRIELESALPTSLQRVIDGLPRESK